MSVIFVPAKGTHSGETIDAGYWLSTGPTGTDISDDGQDWRSIGETGFHALSLLPDGTPLATGSEGRIAILKRTQ